MEAPELHELEDIKYVTVVDEIHTQIVAMGGKDGHYFQYMVGVVPTQSLQGLIDALEEIEIASIPTTVAFNEVEHAIVEEGP